MSPNLQRGLLLYEQSRYAQAEPEFRQAIAADPNDAHARAMLALCLSLLERYNEAEEETAQALQLDPGMPFVHYVRAVVLHDRNNFRAAESAIAEAIQLDPENPDFRAAQAQIFVSQKKWKQALESAENGLSQDPEHVGCTNFRAIALVNLGRKEDAGKTIDAALAKNPENSFTHANQGWTLLHAGQHKKALEHFRESLRLDPENEWARQGTVEALKARHFTYSLLLKYFLWMSRLSSQAQWGVIIAGFIGIRALRGVAKSNPELGPYILPIQLIYLLFVFLTWTAEPLFNLLLRLNKFGRMVLNREEIVASNWVGAFMGLALLSLLAGFYRPPLMLGAFVFGFSILPVAAVFKCPRGWPRTAMIGYSVIVIGAAFGAMALFAAGSLSAEVSESIHSARAALFGLFALGIILCGWVANFLIMQRVRK